MLHGFGDVTRFVGVERDGLAFPDRAESAVPRADVAPEHESRRAIGPAFKDIRATSFLADRVQVQTLNQLQQVILVGWISQANPQPFGLGLAGLGIKDVEFAGQTLNYLDEQHHSIGVWPTHLDPGLMGPIGQMGPMRV